MNKLEKYLYCLQGIQIRKDIHKASELYIKNWKETNHSDSIYKYAWYLRSGRGGEKDEQETNGYI